MSLVPTASKLVPTSPVTKKRSRCTTQDREVREQHYLGKNNISVRIFRLLNTEAWDNTEIPSDGVTYE